MRRANANCAEKKIETMKHVIKNCELTGDKKK